MKLFLDTNIIIDLVTGRPPFGHDAGLIYRLRFESEISLLESIVPNLTITNMGRAVIERSLQKRGKDFEDDAQYFSAVDAGADYIITRNKKDFPQEDFVVEPKEFFKLMNIEA